MDQAIAKLEVEKTEIERKFMNNEIPQEEVITMTSRLSEIASELEIKELRWLELSEIV